MEVHRIYAGGPIHMVVHVQIQSGAVTGESLRTNPTFFHAN